MKRFFATMSVIALLPIAGFSAQQEGQYSYAKDMYGDLNVGYAAKPKPSSYVDKFYLGGRGELSFLTWKNKYTANELSGSDSFTFKPLLGLDVFAGYRVADKWRIDAEFGYITEFSESETEDHTVTIDVPNIQKDTFTFQTYNLTANFYYDLRHNLYIGAGVGVAISKISVEDSTFGKVESTNASPMGALMVGWSNRLDENTDFDIRYRLSMSGGGDVALDVGGGQYVKTNIDSVIDNSISAGVRVYF